MSEGQEVERLLLRKIKCGSISLYRFESVLLLIGCHLCYQTGFSRENV